VADLEIIHSELRAKDKERLAGAARGGGAAVIGGICGGGRSLIVTSGWRQKQGML
jgi:hypothetical protein